MGVIFEVREKKEHDGIHTYTHTHTERERERWYEEIAWRYRWERYYSCVPLLASL